MSTATLPPESVKTESTTNATATAPKSTSTKEWLPAARFEELKEGEPKIVTLGGTSIGIIRSGEEVHAILNFCPHAGAPVCTRARLGGLVGSEIDGTLTYDNAHKVIRCPWHHWEFHLESGLPVVKTRGKLRKFPTRVCDGVVEVQA